MSTYICSDIHLSHKNIMQYCPARRMGKDMPTQEDDIKAMVSRMNEQIIANFNSMVQPTDDVFILGDVAMSIIANAPPLIRRLNGNKMLVAGNHDKTLRKLIKNAAGELDDLFVWIKDYYETFVRTQTGEKVLVCMSHYPMSHWNLMNTGSIFFHGHLHGSPSGITGRIKDVGIDTNDLHPYLLDSVVADMMKINIIRDHH